MSVTWNTKWGARRVRHDPPTLREAILAAQGLTDDREQQVEIAATLMGVGLAEARAVLKELAPDRRTTLTMVAATRDKGPRMVLVEHRASRRVAARNQIQRPNAMRSR